jgi:hypothetical protein
LRKKPLINYSKSHTCCDFCKILIDFIFLKDKVAANEIKEVKWKERKEEEGHNSN